MSKKCLKCGKINDDLVSTCIDCKSNDFQQLETKKDVSKIVFISAFTIVFIILIVLIFQYNNLSKQYKTLQSNYEGYKDNYYKILTERDELKEKLKKSKLSNKSQSEIKKMKEQEMEEELNSVGLKLDYIKTYWTGKRSATWLGFNSVMYPCIEISLPNITNKKLDSITVDVAFGGNMGSADVIVDNVHPNRSAIVTIKPNVGKKPNSGDMRDMPDVEADIRVSVNDGKKISLGLIKIDKKYQQMK